MERATAAIITVGTELVTGLRADTNGREVAWRLRAAGFSVKRIVSVPDETAAIAAAVSECAQEHRLIVITGGLGPTHDDVTREAVAAALGVPLRRDDSLAQRMAEVGRRHTTAEAAADALKQADVFEGAHVLEAQTGTAPGQVIEHKGATIVLLPGPPQEMRPMLESFLADATSVAPPRVLRCTGITESDAAVRAGGALAGRPGIGFTVLAAPSLVDVVLFDDGAGPDVLDDVAREAAARLGERCYSTDGRTLAEVVIDLARESRTTLALAESCTGGSIAVALTDVPGASNVFAGGAVVYSNAAKTALLGVGEDLLERHGAVSPECAVALAEGARERFDADLALSVTGIAGPGGGTALKPVGLVWFGVAERDASGRAEERRFHGDRATVRARATVHALDLLRTALRG